MNIFGTAVKVDNGAFGVKYDLFAVGLNSLMAVQAAGIVSKTFKVSGHISLR